MKKILFQLRILFLQYTNWREQKRQDRNANFKHFRKTVRLAEENAKDDNKRYRVFFVGEYIAVTKDDIQRYKNRGIIDKQQNTGILSQDCLYDTQMHANTHPIFQNRKL